MGGIVGGKKEYERKGDGRYVDDYKGRFKNRGGREERGRRRNNSESTDGRKAVEDSRGIREQ